MQALMTEVLGGDAVEAVDAEENEENEQEAFINLNEAIKKELIEGYMKDTTFKQIYEILKHNLKVPKDIHNHINHFEIGKDNLLYFKASANDDSRVCVPKIPSIRTKFLHQCHDLPCAGHFGVEKTFELLSRTVYWPKLKNTVKKYVKTCDTCQRMKSSTSHKNGLFNPLEVPVGRWTHVTMDFVTGIPRTDQGFDAIMIVVDRLSKRAHFLPCTKDFSSADTARLYLDQIFRLHGIPKHITSDKDIKFMASFWQTLHKGLGTELLFTTTNHPAADGQSERTYV
ncbi:unnamed protein product [Ambrosiozyma monospora]|uniref:Unnamed protein product n=1 Tax=Ambrosiozyma monospora TaxID=43982 RepID=A0A9W6YTN9_AMBMO|nr:unnamed protein product [Ambrosiozyma monospora]